MLWVALSFLLAVAAAAWMAEQELLELAETVVVPREALVRRAPLSMRWKQLAAAAAVVATTTTTRPATTEVVQAERAWCCCLMQCRVKNKCGQVRADQR
jgi:hypothetical protein